MEIEGFRLRIVRRARPDRRARAADPAEFDRLRVVLREATDARRRRGRFGSRREFQTQNGAMRVTPLGAVKILSTHDQLPSAGQRTGFLGSRFPADAGYARSSRARR